MIADALTVVGAAIMSATALYWLAGDWFIENWRTTMKEMFTDSDPMRGPEFMFPADGSTKKPYEPPPARGDERPTLAQIVRGESGGTVTIDEVVAISGRSRSTLNDWAASDKNRHALIMIVRGIDYSKRHGL